MRQLRHVFIALTGLCLLPLVSVLLAALLAALFGCELNEGSQQACYVLGLDFGGVLSTMFVMGWLALMTLPLLAAILALWGVLEGGVFWRGRRRARKDVIEAPAGEEA